MKFELITLPQFEKSFKKLEKNMQRRISEKIRISAKDPYGLSKLANVIKLEQSKNRYRLKVGPFRVIYRVTNRPNKVILETVAHRREVYR